MSFAEIWGQKPAIKFLQASLQKGQIAHAYLFYGIEGIGKEKTARIFAKAINCLSPEGIEACGRCRSCLQIENNIHPDIIFIKPDGAFIRIAQIRELQRQLIYKPLEGRYRVAIITNADFLNIQSSNCLLKTLEEPPETSIIILIATDIDGLLPTIVSRCQNISFSPLSPAVITKYLCSCEKDRISSEQATLLASLSGGSLGRAIKLSTSSFLKNRREICKQLTSLSKQDLEKVLALAQNLVSNKEELPEILNMFKTFFRDLLLLKQDIDEKYLINKDLKANLLEDIKKWTDKRLIHGLELLQGAEGALAKNYNRQLLLENIFLQLVK